MNEKFPRPKIGFCLRIFQRLRPFFVKGHATKVILRPSSDFRAFEERTNNRIIKNGVS